MAPVSLAAAPSRSGDAWPRSLAGPGRSLDVVRLLAVIAAIVASGLFWFALFRWLLSR
jgi:hypothetical protein